MKPTTISVILPNYNGAKHLQPALESFARQTQDGTELIIVDAKSTDDSHTFIATFCRNHSNATWIREPDRGISDALNIGIHHAKGTYIGYLGSDDWLVEGVLQTVQEYARQIDADSFYFDSYTFNLSEGQCNYRRCPNVPFTRENLYQYGTIAGLQDIFIHKRVFQRTMYNVANKYSMDYELYLEMTAAPGSHVYIPKPATINLYGGNITQRLQLEQFHESIRAAIRHAKTTREVLWTYRRLHTTRNALRLYAVLLTTAFRLIGNNHSVIGILERELYQRYRALRVQ